MKRSFNILIKGLLVIVLFTGTTIALSSAGVKTVNEAKAAVSYDFVYNYLVNHGYQVLTLAATKGTADWDAQTYKNGTFYYTHVYVQGSAIVGQVDTPL
jgi:hypothetical protein